MEEAGSKKEPSKPADGEDKKGGLRASAVIAVALAAGFLIWLLLIKGGGNSSTTLEEPAGATTVKVVPESGLLKAMKGVGYPVYWAGPRPRVEYEVQRLPSRTYVRYLPEGEEAESKKRFLTVGSYEETDALGGIDELGQKSGAILVKTAGGGKAYAEGPQATSAYMAFPEIDVQVEVYDPQPGRALGLIRSGAIAPVD